MEDRLRTVYPFYWHRIYISLLGIALFCGLSASARAADVAPTAFVVSVSSASVCAGSSTTLIAAGCPAGGTVRWSTAQTGTTILVSPVQTTTYTAACEVTGPAAETVTAVGTVQVVPPIKLSPVASLSVLCHGGNDGQVAINASGGTGVLQYQFNGQPYQSLNSTFGNLAAGTYTVGVRDALGCQAQGVVEVKQPSSLSVSVTTISPGCAGRADGSFIAAAWGGAGDYRYSLTPGTPQVSGAFINLKADTAYSLIVSDKNNCVLSRQVVITPPVPVLIKLASIPTRCVGSADGIVSVSATGGAGSFQYKLGTGLLQTGALFTGLAAGTYDVTVVDGYGCPGNQTVTVGQPAPLLLAASVVPVSCKGGTSGAIRMTSTGGTGAVTYQLSAGSLSQTNPVFTGIGVGDYTIVGIDANGCSSLTSVTVGIAEPLKLQAVSIAATCCVCATGGFRLSTTGGSGTLRQYQLVGQPYQTATVLTGLRPNTYRLRVTDEAGCMDSTVAVVTDGNAMTLSVGTKKEVTCTGGNDGAATIQVAGGTKPFTYYWTTERRDTLKPYVATQTGLLAGTYTIRVLDSNRCSTSTLFVPIKALFPIPAKPIVSVAGSSTLLVDQTTGVQWYVRAGNDPGKEVPNATGSTLVPLQSGQYYAVVTTNGCTSPPSDPINFVLTAVAEPVLGLAVRVLPNPVTNRLRIEVEQAVRSALTVQLLDASGRVVLVGQLPAFIGKKQAEWPLAGVSAGQYLLQVIADTRQSVSRVAVE